MTHGGCTARIEFDERHDTFVSRILGSRCRISFHGGAVAKLRREFAAAAEDYAEDCKARGIEPDKPASGKLLLAMPPEIGSRAIVAAQAKGKSLDQSVTVALQRAVAEG
jgi:predicted HicB family RNase H-like nuclease